MVDSYPILTLVPPLVAIALAIITRKVLLSLGIGVVAAALLVAGFNPLEALTTMVGTFADQVWTEDGLNTTKVYIVIFTFSLGLIATFIMMSGGTKAFADWAQTRISTRRGAAILPAGLGASIFVDDYFNALAVGQVSRPVTDRYRISRAKLTYLVDSTSAPVAVLVPFSSWGAFILGLFAPIIAESSLEVSDIGGFLQAAAANYYAWAALAMVALAVATRLDLGPMRTEERRALRSGECYDSDEEIPGELSADLPMHAPGQKRALIVPFLLLTAGVLGGIVQTGRSAAESWSIVDIMANTDVTLSLIYGAVLGLASALYYYVRYTSENPKFGADTFGRGVKEGLASMLPAVAILTLAWVLADLIETLGTGKYLGSLVEGSGISAAWLVPVIFLLAGAMAFSTGTSWGSFGLLLPIAGGIVNSLDAPELLLPALGAVLAGAVAGDHASPISDTTILSSTGAGCNVITHVNTQLPYALTAVTAALLGYITLALVGSTSLGLLVTFASVLLFAVIARTVLDPVVPDEEMPSSYAPQETADA